MAADLDGLLTDITGFKEIQRQIIGYRLPQEIGSKGFAECLKIFGVAAEKVASARQGRDVVDEKQQVDRRGAEFDVKRRTVVARQGFVEQGEEAFLIDRSVRVECGGTAAPTDDVGCREGYTGVG